MATNQECKQTQIDKMETKIDWLVKMFEKFRDDQDEMSKAVKETQSRMVKIEEKMETVIVTDIQNLTTATEVNKVKVSRHDDEIGALKLELESQTRRNDSLQEKFNELDRVHRSLGIYIDNLPRDTDSDNVKVVLDDFLSDLGLQFRSSDVANVYRVGKKHQDTDSRPRRVYVRLSSTTQKGDLYKNLYKLKDFTKWSKVFVNDDLTSIDLQKQRELRTIVTKARLVGRKCKLSGLTLKLDDKSYKFSELNTLPDELQPQNSAIFTSEDGVSFSGKNAFLSNLHKSPIVFEQEEFKSVESAYQTIHARTVGKPEVAKLLKTEVDTYKILQVSRSLPDTAQWKVEKEVLMKKLVTEKFLQNQELKDKLKATTGYIYEMTTDQFWGTGIPFSKSKLVKQGFPGSNKMGTILVQLRDSLKSQ